MDQDSTTADTASMLGSTLSFLLTTVQTLLKLGLMGVAGLAGLLYVKQTTLIYATDVPAGSRQFVDTPNQYGMDPYEDLTVTTTDGQRLHAYFIKQPSEAWRKEAPTILYCHANAGNMGHRLPIVRIFYSKFRCNVLIFSYRGCVLGVGSVEWCLIMLY